MRLKQYAILMFSLVIHTGCVTPQAGTDQVIVSEVVSVYDGDTFTANIAGWPEVIGENIGIRIKGVDTPEIRGKCEAEKKAAQDAKEFTEGVLVSAKSVILEDIERDKYFRIAAVVYADGENVGLALIQQGLGVPYDGGTKTEFCKIQ